MPPWADESLPRPVPSFAAPDPDPLSPPPGPSPRPIPLPPPLPPRPGCVPPAGDMAIAPGPPLPGRPTVVPGWAEITSPFPAPLPPPPGGANAEPASILLPRPEPLLPVPRPVRALASFLGAGATTPEPSPPVMPRLDPAREPSPVALCVGGIGAPPRDALKVPPCRPEPPDEPEPTLGGGAMTCGAPSVPPAMPCVSGRPPPLPEIELPPPSCGGGGTI